MTRTSNEVETVPPGACDRWEAYPFAWKERQYRGMSDEALAWARTDASAAALSMRGMGPNSRGMSPSSWYMDDAATIAAEIERRRVKARK